MNNSLKPFIGKASVSWGGHADRRKGAITTPSMVLTRTAYGSGQGTHRRLTHPSELIAAAHACSFSVALADELDATGYTTDQIDTIATVTMEHIATRWTMTRVHLEVIATVQDGEQFDFVDATLRAKANCPVSRLLTANISMQATLKRAPGTPLHPNRKASRARRLTARPKTSV
jgi:osmotically inducible protein OsmC